jgi:hypothetical protein
MLSNSVKQPFRMSIGAIAAICILVATPIFADNAQLPMVVRGSKSVQILPDAPGLLTVTISKRDMRIYQETSDLTVTVENPSHRKIAEIVIPGTDRTQPPSVQTDELQFEVDQVGVYHIDIVVGGHGDVLWGLQLSSGRYIVLGEVFVNNASFDGNIYFPAPQGQFTLSALTPHDVGRQQIGLFDASGVRVGTLNLQERGKAKWIEVRADTGDRSGPWHVSLAAMNVRVVSPAIKYWATEKEMLFDPAGTESVIIPAAKREATYYTPERIATGRENVARYDWANETLNTIMRGQPYSYLIGRDYTSAADYSAQSDDFMWELQPPTTIPRIYTFEARAECPVCGVEVRKFNAWHPWRLDPINHPYQIQCRMCDRWFPSNDFGAGDMTSGPYPDDGSGWVAPDGRRFFFIREYAHACYTGVTIPTLKSLSQAWVLTGDPKYAHKCAVLLARLASVYPNHDDRQEWLWGAAYGGYHPHYTSKTGGMITDLIWETFCSESAVYAYDAIYEYLDDAPELFEFLQAKGMPVKNAEEFRNYVNHYLLRAAAVGVLKGAISGNPGHHQALAMALALVMNDYSDSYPNSKHLVDWAYHGVGRTAYMMTNALYRDGGGHESPSYNAIKLDFIRVSQVMEEIRAQHPEIYPVEQYPDIFANEKASSIFDYFVAMNTLGVFQPSIGDGGSQIGVIKRHAPHSWSTVYAENLFGFQKYGEPRYARAATLRNGTIAPGKLFDTYPGDELKMALEDPASEIYTGPRLLDGYGVGILESEDGDNGRALVLNYAAIVGHRQANNLHMELYARGMNILPDLGYPFTWDYTQQWDCHTMGHNTVTVNDTIADMGQCAGNAASLFASHDGVHVISARHVPYPAEFQVGGQPGPAGVDQYERTSVLVDVDDERFYVVDLFAVSGGDQHDQSWHGPLVEPVLPDLDWQVQSTGTLAGPDVEQFAEYTDHWGRTWTNFPCFVKDVKRAQLDEPRFWEWDFGMEEGDRLRIHVVPVGGPLEAIMCAGRSPARPADWRLDYLLCRRMVEEGQRSLYLTVLDAFQGQPVVQQVRLISEDPLELEITYDGGIDRVSLATPAGPSTTNEPREHGLRVVSTRDGQSVRDVQIGSWAPGQGPGYVTQQIQEVDYQGRQIALTPEAGQETEFAVGRGLRIYNADRSSMYTITDVAQQDGHLWLTLDTTALLARGPVTGANEDAVELGVSSIFATALMNAEGRINTPGPYFFGGARLGEGELARPLAAMANKSNVSARVFLKEPVSAEVLLRDYGDTVVSIWDYGVGDSVELAVVR